MEKSNNPSRFLKKIQKYFEWVVLITLFALVISCIYTFFIATPIYSSSSEMLLALSNTETEETVTPPPSSMATYSHILTSDVILDPVIEELALDTTPSDLREQVSAEYVENSEIITVYVEDENPYQASFIANAVAETFEEVTEQTTDAETVQIITSAVASTNPIRPNHVQNILIGTVIGFIISIGVVAAKRAEANPEVISPEMAKELTGYRSMGKISPFTEEDYMILKVRPNRVREAASEKEQPDEENLSRMSRHRF